MNLLNSKFNRLTILSFSHSDKKYKYYNCRCDCGNSCIIKGSNIKSGHTKSCGCLQKETSSKLIKTRNLSKGKKDMTFYHYTRNAKKRNIKFELTKEEFYNIKNNVCTYCPKIGPNGIDRIDNNLGYTTNNCVSCCSKCNRAKGIMSFSDFKNWIKQVYQKLYKE